MSRFPVDIGQRARERHGLGERSERRFEGRTNDDLFRQMASDLAALRATKTIDRRFLARRVTLSAVPVQIIGDSAPRPYIIVNPEPGAVAVQTGTLLASALHAALATGDTTATPLVVSGFRTARLFLDISASTGGTVKIDVLTKDPVSGLWATAQSDIFALPSAVGTYYADIGEIGVDTDLAIRWTVGAAGNSTFSVGYVLKDGMSLPSARKIAYLGSSDAVNAVNGYALVEGAEKEFYARDETYIFAMSLVPVTLSIFELS